MMETLSLKMRHNHYLGKIRQYIQGSFLKPYCPICNKDAKNDLNNFNLIMAFVNESMCDQGRAIDDNIAALTYKLEQVLGFDCVNIWECDEDVGIDTSSFQNRISDSFTYNSDVMEIKKLSLKHRFSHGAGIISVIQRQKKPLFIEDFEKSSYVLGRNNKINRKVKSFVGAPICIDGEVRFILELLSFKPYYFSVQDKSLIMKIAQSLSGYILSQQQLYSTRIISCLAENYVKLHNLTKYKAIVQDSHNYLGADSLNEMIKIFTEVCKNVIPESDIYTAIFDDSNIGFSIISGQDDLEVLGESIFLHLSNKKILHPCNRTLELHNNDSKFKRYKYIFVIPVIDKNKNYIAQIVMGFYIKPLPFVINEIKKLGVFIEEYIIDRDEWNLHMREMVKLNLSIESIETSLISTNHDMRTPLNAIMGYAELLKIQENIAPEKQDSYLKAISDNSKTLHELINNLLDSKTIAKSMMTLEVSSFDLNLLYDEIETLYINYDKNIDFIITKPELFPELIIADKQKIKRVLTNLISNAFKYTSKGSVTAEIAILKQSDSLCDLDIKVSDTGVGIEKESLERIFLPYERNDKEGNTGTGLGLSICTELIRIMDGSISVHSKVGNGTIFNVSIPIEIKSTQLPSVDHQV